MSWQIPWSRPDTKTRSGREEVAPFLNVLAPMAMEFHPRSVPVIEKSCRLSPIVIPRHSLRPKRGAIYPGKCQKISQGTRPNQRYNPKPIGSPEHPRGIGKRQPAHDEAPDHHPHLGPAPPGKELIAQGNRLRN